MPCTYTGSLEGDREMAMRESLDARERMLCALCRRLETELGAAEAGRIMAAAERMADGSAPIVDWWVRHREADAAAGRR